MHDRRLAGLGLVLGQPRGEPVEHRQLARAVVLPQAAEAAELAVEVTGRLAVALEAAGAPVDGVDLHQRVDQLLADAAFLAVQRPWNLRRHDVARDPLHHVERRADHGLVVARGEDVGSAHLHGLDGAQQLRLAQHVVGRWRQRRPGRPAQHPAPAVPGDQVRDVRVALADRLGFDRPFTESLGVKKRLQRAPHEQRRKLQRSGLLGGVHDRRHRSAPYPGTATWAPVPGWGL